MQPFEIIGAPLTLWLAPVATAFPLISADPSGSWIKVGTNGDKNQSGEGVTVTHGYTFQEVKPGGTTGPVKAFLDEENLSFGLTLWDLSLEQYQLALAGTAPSTTAAGVGTAGYKKIGLSHSSTVKEYALLARGVSPYGDGWSMQYEVPRCYQSGSPSPVYRKAQPSGLALRWTALEDMGASSAEERFGRLIAQHAAAL
ncbi:hypothetical protein KRZ98_06220 [Sphingobium sp. AS12]|uniref:hypothetical protein n=1 Tax=Sphingobium sp. AS12 TaxID=2849495 RepID=UPI001C311F2B|nr:hypothetical protein [Sphingobium sp. AS12]MBV2147885.1 hypothetical protein [Sphingobium sp. AS12]